VHPKLFEWVQQTRLLVNGLEFDSLIEHIGGQEIRKLAKIQEPDYRICTLMICLWNCGWMHRRKEWRNDATIVMFLHKMHAIVKPDKLTTVGSCMCTILLHQRHRVDRYCFNMPLELFQKTRTLDYLAVNNTN